LWKPVYKSEAKPCIGGIFEWNFVNLMTSDLINEKQDIFKFEFFKQ